MNNWLYLVPLTTAGVGWLTVRVAVKLLFYPEKPVKFAGFVWQGFIPRHQSRYAGAIAAGVKNELLSSAQISLLLSDQSVLKKISPELENHIDHFLRNKLKESMPVVGMLIGDRTINQLKELFMKELELLFPVVMKNYAGHLQDDSVIEQIIKDKLAGWSPDQIRELLIKSLSRELFFLRLLAVCIGIAVGLLQVMLIIIFSR